MTDLRQYNPLEVVGTFTTPGPFGAIDILDGRVSEEFMALTRDNKLWVREFDQAGNATRVKVNNRGGILPITLSASSPTNATLSGVVALDNGSENQVGVVSVSDLNGTTTIVAEGAFLEDVPDPSFSGSRGSRTWIWQCQLIRVFVGGHNLA